MKIAFDIGGVLSKYPEQFKSFLRTLAVNHEIFVITDMHDHAEVVETLKQNGFEVPAPNVFCADYAKYGDMCKAKLLAELKIDIFVDDFVGYLQWDSSFGPAPIRMLLMPDGFKPYWHDSWQVKTDCDFGRRRYHK